jgi:hypothetical protein
MKAWWDYYKNELPTISEEEKKYVEDMTGCIPLLLRALRKHKKPQALKVVSDLEVASEEVASDFKEVASDFKESDEIVAVLSQVEKFISNVKLNATEEQWNWWVFFFFIVSLIINVSFYTCYLKFAGTANSWRHVLSAVLRRLVVYRSCTTFAISTWIRQLDIPFADWHGTKRQSSFVFLEEILF